jgi:hypothetical protein
MVGNFAVAVAASNDHKSSKNLKKKIKVRWSDNHFAFGRRALWGYIPMQKKF